MSDVPPQTQKPLQSPISSLPILEPEKPRGRLFLPFVIAIILLTAALGCVVWLLLHPRTIEKTISLSTVQSSATSRSSSATNEDKTSAYGYIDEFGLKYTKTDNQKHLAYTIEPLDSDSKMAYFMTSVAISDCGPHYAGYIEQSASQIKDLDGSVRADEKKIGNYWYVYTSPQSSNCVATMNNSVLMKTIENESIIVKREIFATLELK